jgi:hypothetical protein
LIGLRGWFSLAETCGMARSYCCWEVCEDPAIQATPVDLEGRGHGGWGAAACAGMPTRTALDRKEGSR